MPHPMIQPHFPVKSDSVYLPCWLFQYKDCSNSQVDSDIQLVFICCDTLFFFFRLAKTCARLDISIHWILCYKSRAEFLSFFFYISSQHILAWESLYINKTRHSAKLNYYLYLLSNLWPIISRELRMNKVILCKYPVSVWVLLINYGPRQTRTLLNLSITPTF